MWKCKKRLLDGQTVRIQSSLRKEVGDPLQQMVEEGPKLCETQLMDWNDSTRELGAWLLTLNNVCHEV